MKRNLYLAGAWMSMVYVFLYLPIVTLIAYSFNDSKMVSLWGGFTFKWYLNIFQDTEIVEALLLSLKIALWTATSSVLLGTAAAFALVRYRVFKGRTFFNAMVNAPLVMPEVIIGLSLLLLLVAAQRTFGFPERGMTTIWLGHTMIGLSFAAVVIQSRLVEMDHSLEEAALDLGAKPLQVFWLVTLPMISQSLVAAWLLTFTLSFDNVVVSAFLSGPGSTTLPIEIFSRARLGLNPSVNVIATLTVVLVGFFVVFGSVWLARQERRRAKEQAESYRDASSPTLSAPLK